MNEVRILGQGYVGLPTALMFATHWLQVVGVDINKEIVNTLSTGALHIQEPGLSECFDQAIGSGNLAFSLSVEDADVFIVTVPTPFLHDDVGEFGGQPYKKADMRFVISPTEMILPHFEKRKPGDP